MSGLSHDDAGTPDEAGTTKPPLRPTDAETHRIGALVVVSSAAVAHFVPLGTDTRVLASSDTDDGEFLVARLLRGAIHDGDLVVRRFDHAGLRVLGAAASRLLAFASDGPSVAAVLGIPEAAVALMEDGGTMTAAARVAASIGLVPHGGWPEDEAGRVALLLRMLHAAGHHPHAPARTARLAAYMLAVNGEHVPVPLTDDEMIRVGRVAGFGAEALHPGFTLAEAWPQHLGLEERAAMPDEPAVHGLFREAARALARVAPARPDASEPTEDRAI
jgi:hypothetical protein